MPASKAHIKATNKWMAKAYDRINLTVPKGHKEAIQTAAAAGQSVNAYINQAIDARMEGHRSPVGGGEGVQREREGIHE